jgi:hypothetical protein
VAGLGKTAFVEERKSTVNFQVSCLTATSCACPRTPVLALQSHCDVADFMAIFPLPFPSPQNVLYSSVGGTGSSLAHEQPRICIHRKLNATAPLII